MKALLLLSAALLSLPAVADVPGEKVSPEFRQFLLEVYKAKNLVRYEGMKVKLNGFVEAIEKVDGQNGVYAITLDDALNTNLHAAYNGRDTNDVRFICYAGKKTAASIDVGDQVNVEAGIREVRDVQNWKESNGRVSPGRKRVILAQCGG